MENLKETYKKLKWSDSKTIKTILEELNDDDLLSLAKENDLHATLSRNDQSLTNKIRSELFKRNGIGHKQVRHLSVKQSKFLESLNLKSRKDDFNKRFRPKLNTEPVELSQIVLLSNDGDKEIEQFVNYDPADEWICITNDGNAISLSVENWKKLQILADRALGYT